MGARIMTVKTEDKKLLLKIVETKREEIVTFLSNLIGVRSYTGKEGAAQVVVREEIQGHGG